MRRSVVGMCFRIWGSRMVTWLGTGLIVALILPVGGLLLLISGIWSLMNKAAAWGKGF